MDENETRKETAPAVMIIDRRKNRQADLTASDVMKILRKRAAKAMKRGYNAGSGDSGAK